jgi:hypothetical protein
MEAADSRRTPAGRLRRSSLEAAAEPQGESIRVFVRDPARRAIPGATVRVLAASGPLELRAGAAGDCVLSLAFQPLLELEVTASGFLGMRAELVWDERLEIELLPCLAVAGRVRDDETGQPIEGARVHVRRKWPWTPLGDEALSDASGAFRLECAPDVEDAWIMAWAEGYSEWRARVPRRGSQRTAIELALCRGPQLELQVLEHPSGRPLANARVGDDCTDASGRVNLGATTTAEALEIQVRAPGFCTVACSLPPRPAADRTPLLVRLPKLARFEGRVRDREGSPVAGALLELRPSSFEDPRESAVLPALPRGWGYLVETPSGTALSDAQGRYVSPPLLPGAAFTLRAQHPEAGDVIVDAGPLGAPGTLTRLDVTLVPRPTGALEGRVRYNGNWVPGTVSWEYGRRRGSFDLGLDGRYRFAEVDAGWVELAVRSSWLDPVRDFLPGTRASVMVEADRTTRHDFELALPFGELGGRVTYADGRPADGKEIRIEHREPRYDAQDETGSEGTWRESVPDLGWEYEVTLAHGQERLSIPGARAGDLRLDFVLPELVRLPVRVVDDETGEPLAGWKLSWRRHGEADFRRGLACREGQGGRDLFLELLPGVVDLLVQVAESGHVGRRIEGLVLARETASSPLEIRLERGLELEIVLADEVPHPEEQGVRILLGPPSDPRGAPDAVGVEFDQERRARVRGLSAGRHRFCAFPDDVAVEPELVTLPHQAPLVLRWFRR